MFKVYNVYWTRYVRVGVVIQARDEFISSVWEWSGSPMSDSCCEEPIQCLTFQPAERGGGLLFLLHYCNLAHLHHSSHLSSPTSHFSSPTSHLSSPTSHNLLYRIGVVRYSQNIVVLIRATKHFEPVYREHNYYCFSETCMLYEWVLTIFLFGIIST